MAVADLLFHHYGTLDEGDLSRVRANLVKQSSLADIAQKLSFSSHLRLGEGELKSGGFRRPSILADTLEAIIAAIYLDGGMAAAKHVIDRLYKPILASVDPRTLGKDAKTLLQEASAKSAKPQACIADLLGGGHAWCGAQPAV